MSKHMNATESLSDAVEAYRAKLSTEISFPNPDDLRSAIAGCLSKRDGTWRKTAPTGSRDTGAHLLWVLVRWHRGNGSLWSFPHFADPVERDQLDTVAQLLCGGNSPAVDAWRKVLGR